MKNFIFTAIMLLSVAGVVLGCSKEEEPKKEICRCYGENPLIDELPWLRELIEHYKKSISVCIYQCTYHNGMDGFIINPNMGSFASYRYLYNWEGTELDNSQDSPDLITKWDIKTMYLIWIKY